MEIPKDPVILLSYVNTKLRDVYPSLDELCKSLMVDRAHIEATIQIAGYHYDMGQNRFIPTV
jgi:hypothetical protein